MKNCNLPTHQQSLEIMKQYHVPSHIQKHGRAVAKLAVFLAERLKEKGIPVDVDLVDKACLLHDIARVCDFDKPDYSRFEQTVTEKDKLKWQQLHTRYKEVGHEEAAYDILKDKFPLLALTIKKHRYMAMLDEQEKPKAWEEKLLYYSDMRVMHDRIVPLAERLREGHKRNVRLYGGVPISQSLRNGCHSKVQSRINMAKVDSLIFNLEKEIFAELGLDPLKVTDQFIDTY